MPFNGSFAVCSLPFTRSAAIAFAALSLTIRQKVDISLRQFVAVFAVGSRGEVLISRGVHIGQIALTFLAKNFLWSPAITVTANKSVAGNTQLSRPLSQRQSFATELNNKVVPFVIRLNFNSRPNTILSRIIAVIALALDHPATRAFAHIGQKVLKSLPAVTDLDASATIIRIFGTRRIFATLFDASPNAICARASKSMLDLCHVGMLMDYGRLSSAV